MAFPLARNVIVIIILLKMDKKMFVILETGSKQYRVSEGNTIKVEKIEANEGDKVILDNVLFCQNDNGETLIGKPNLENIVVEAEVLRNYKDEKVISGNIICRQRGTKWHPGVNVGLGKDHTIFALVDGVVEFVKKGPMEKVYINVVVNE